MNESGLKPFVYPSTSGSSWAAKRNSIPYAPRVVANERAWTSDENNHWEVYRSFCEPASSITAPACEAYADIFSKAVQAVRTAASERSSSTVQQNTRVVSAALVIACQLDEKGADREASREIMAFVETYLSYGSLVEPNRLLAEANIEKMTVRSLIGLIRSTAIARNKLPAWERAYTRAWHRIQKLERAPERIFIGLPKPSEVANAETPG